MSKNEVEKRQDLCEKLNMNFEEANELFGTETLMSIQMAQVNGGSGLPTIIREILKGGAIEALRDALSKLWDYATDFLKGLVTPSPETERDGDDVIIRNLESPGSYIKKDSTGIYVRTAGGAEFRYSKTSFESYTPSPEQ